jgi:tRNA uridine 5-carboxymethylaminomethyl modification enzyme
VNERRYRVIVIGGGHAGAEAAWAAANLLPAERFGPGAVALVTIDPAKIGVMSCNPAIGGLAKGQIVREIDALGGLMGLATDATGIQFKVLNTSKGQAVRGPRAQCDKHAYAEAVQGLIASRPEIEVVSGTVERLVVEGGRMTGVVVHRPGAPGPGDLLSSSAVVLTTGTFMRGLMHTGEQKTEGGRHGEAAAVGISGALRDLGFEVGRLKTGTPPRLKRSTIDWEGLEKQLSDDPPVRFSDLTGAGFPRMAQVDCRITATTSGVHDLIRANLHRAPMYSGQIESVGPRYCPSIEDKVVRFADKPSHQVFLEPESHRDDWVYCNGISTSLPGDVQEAMVRAMPGCGRARVYRYGYAVEYDMVRPHQIHVTGMTKRVQGLFLAGQINGTSGYEEAAGQGLVAGANAARYALGLDEFMLGRDEAYIGVMMDDLVTKTPVEPYRMFTSRAEHRLLLRADNAPDRLTPRAIELGLLDSTDLGRRRRALFERRRREAADLNMRIDAARAGEKPLASIIRAPDFTEADLRGAVAGDYMDAVWGTVFADRRYEAYIVRQRAEIKRRAEMEHRRIPAHIRYEDLPALRTETRLALARFRPATFGQAARLEGVTPADLTLLSVLAKRG